MLKEDRRLFYWLPVIIWLEVIFIFSSIPGSSLPPMPSESTHFWAHRAAHFGEYFILGVLVFRAYASMRMRSGKEVSGFKFTSLLSWAVFIFLCGLFDEWHQSFIPGRDPQLLDAIYDTICGTWGMYVYFKWLKLRKA